MEHKFHLLFLIIPGLQTKQHLILILMMIILRLNDETNNISSIIIIIMIIRNIIDNASNHYSTRAQDPAAVPHRPRTALSISGSVRVGCY